MIVFPDSAPQTRKQLYEVIVSQLPEWQARAIVRFCDIIRTVDHAEIYDKIVTKAEAKYGEFSFWNIDSAKELRQEMTDLLVYLAIEDMKHHYSRTDAPEQTTQR